MPELDFLCEKLGGVNKIIRVDENMLNYKMKSHKRRPHMNKTDALCVIEFDTDIKRVFSYTTIIIKN